MLSAISSGAPANPGTLVIILLAKPCSLWRVGGLLEEAEVKKDPRRAGLSPLCRSCGRRGRLYGLPRTLSCTASTTQFGVPSVLASAPPIGAVRSVDCELKTRYVRAAS